MSKSPSLILHEDNTHFLGLVQYFWQSYRNNLGVLKIPQHETSPAIKHATHSFTTTWKSPWGNEHFTRKAEGNGLEEQRLGVGKNEWKSEGEVKSPSHNHKMPGHSAGGSFVTPPTLNNTTPHPTLIGLPTGTCKAFPRRSQRLICLSPPIEMGAHLLPLLFCFILFISKHSHDSHCQLQSIS